jgi:hypothetical protein
MRRCDSMREDGSLVVEAVVGLGLLALVTASLATFMPALRDAHERAAGHNALLAIAELTLERTSSGAEASGVDGAIEVTVLATPITSSLCDAAGEGDSFAVRVADTVRSGSRDVLVEGVAAPRRTSASPSPLPASIRIHRPLLSGATLVATRGDVVTPLVDDEAGPCAVLQGAIPARYAIGPTDPSSLLIGATHLLLREHPVGVTVAGRSVERDILVAQGGRLTVEVDAMGGRPPDTVSTGGLLWTVRGDDAREARGLGAERVVHPGEVTVVVSACRSAESMGSPLRVVMDAGEVSTAVVPLATVTLLGIGTRTGWTLNATRMTDCVDGSTRRPSLAWSGALYDGMRIALPRGSWQLSLTAPGMPESPRMLVAAGEPDLVVVMR